jgi:hypothetical protein
VPAIGTPAIGTPAIGTPAIGTPAIGTPAIGTPFFPGYGVPAIGTPAIGTPAIGTPAIGTPSFKSYSVEQEEGLEPGDTVTAEWQYKVVPVVVPVLVFKKVTHGTPEKPGGKEKGKDKPAGT